VCQVCQVCCSLNSVAVRHVRHVCQVCQCVMSVKCVAVCQCVMSIKCVAVYQVCCSLLGCNNGVCRNFSKSETVSCNLDRNTETVILRFFDRTGVILETPELFIKAYFTHEPMYTYLPLSISVWNMQEHWDSGLFCFGDCRVCGIFPPLLRFV